MVMPDARLEPTDPPELTEAEGDRIEARNQPRDYGALVGYGLTIAALCYLVPRILMGVM